MPTKSVVSSTVGSAKGASTKALRLALPSASKQLTQPSSAPDSVARWMRIVPSYSWPRDSTRTRVPAESLPALALSRPISARILSLMSVMNTAAPPWPSMVSAERTSTVLTPFGCFATSPLLSDVKAGCRVSCADSFISMTAPVCASRTIKAIRRAAAGSCRAQLQDRTLRHAAAPSALHGPRSTMLRTCSVDPTCFLLGV